MADINPVQAFSLVADMAYLSKRPLPVAPDGYYDWQVSSDPADKREGHATVTNLVNRVQAFKAKGGYQPDPRHVEAFLDSAWNPQAVDDRKLSFATGLGILARLDTSTDLYKKLNNVVIGGLYNTIPHPPASYMGPAHCFRQADGYGNNLHQPNLGQSRLPYARSVQGRCGLPRASLPDPGLIFDTILQRKNIQDHSGGMSSLIFSFASLVTHSLFRTDLHDMNINNASSYLDLSPLYGDNQTAQDKVRDKAAGRGLLYPDTFSEERLTFLPPASSVLLVIFSRNHNYIAEKLLAINERRLWTDPPPTDATQKATQDEQIFQTAKLVNCGHFMSMVLGDYVNSFLGASEGCNWDMSALDVIKSKELQVDRGGGNHVSVEFNILYRWHATASEWDQQWTEKVFNKAFGGKPFNQLTTKDFPVVFKAFEALESNPSKRTFGGLTRGPDGKFSDDDLANILQGATERPAGSFRGRGTPGVLRLIEIMGMEQARQWGVCTMNEFRRFLGLKELESFEEWNPDPEIAGTARRLYGHIDNLELYTGLQAESTMPLTDGSRFACGFTTTRGILGDAIALLRGDRFFTSDFTPANLTAWGFSDCQRDMDNGCRGGQIAKLVLRHLPRHFPWNSVYTLYPLFTPAHMKGSLTKQGIEKKYTFDRPTPLRVPKVLNTFTGIQSVFGDPSRFKVIYEKYGYGSILMFDENPKHENDKAMVLHALFPMKEAMNMHVSWVGKTFRDKLKEKTWQYPNVPGNYVDIVKDVINIVSTHVAAEKLTGIELKTKDNPSAPYTEQEVFDMLTTLYTVTFLVFDDPGRSFALHEASAQAGAIIGGLTAKSLMAIAPSLAPNFLLGVGAKVGAFLHPPQKRGCYPFLGLLAQTGRPLDELLGNILGVAVGASVNYAHAAVHVIDFYFDDAREKERKHIIELCNSKDAKSAELLRGYVCEAMRLRPQFPGLWREAVVDATVPQGPGLPPVEIKKGDRIFASFRNANLNPSEFPDPTSVNPSRPASSYHLNGIGFHNCPGTDYAQLTILEMVKAVFQLKNVRRAPGDAGRLKKISETIHETETDVYIQRNGSTSPYPGSIHLVYDS